ncbi:DUF1835 domain-containing protein [Flammeovirga pectinis]|uniref:DUF1835 domain-containing protein n=1 Tax=Flammeovirga pectinis TaxID=2494373 RepID=A0A3S9NZH4_9BACT|nr:DUF3658 domain-containing protein [Flammeovirga pectinis]AZQ61335.1 DUF1835 domain-containing protein [Flammeovirga pectinis]
MYHICLSDPEFGGLKYFFSEKNINATEHNLICLQNELSVGPLSAELEASVLKDRTAFFKEYFEFDTISADYYIAKFIHPNYFSDLNEYSSIVVWKGENVAEELLLRFVAKFSEFKNIYVAEVGSIDSEYKNVAEVDPILFTSLWRNWKCITSNQKVELIEDWNKLGKQSLRILENQSIIEVPFTYYDELLLSFLTTTFQSAGKVIGQTLSSIDQRISDTFIYFRVRNLITHQKVVYEGDLLSMIDLKLKLPK